MSSLRRQIATSDAPWAAAARSVYRGLRSFGVPVPHPLARVMAGVYGLIRTGIYTFRRVFIAEPLFKGYCTSYGRNLRTGVFVHFVQGTGVLELGDDVTVDGKSSFLFASRFSERPTLKIGDRTGIGHACMFTVGKRIDIGEDCRIAGNVWMFDSPGHPSDPAARLTGAPPDPDQVRPITIGRNVWIGGHSIIFPGVTIGEGSVVAAGSVVTADVAAGVVVAGNPARRIAALGPQAAVTPRPASQSIPDTSGLQTGGPIGG